MPPGSEVPEGWERVTLPQVVDICMGQSPPGKSYNEEGVGLPFFQGKADFTDYHPAVRVYCTEPKKIVNPGDILISVRAPVGPTNVADRVCAIGRGLAGLAPLAEIPTNYILFSLRYKEPEIGLWGTGTTFKAINKSHLESIELPLPPLAEQHRIVAAIEALFTRLDAANARLDRVPGIVKQFRQSVLAAACDGRLTEDWRAEHPSVESASNILNRNAENCRQIWEGEQLRKFQTKGKLPRGGEWKNDYHPSVRPADTPSDELPRSWVWASPDEIKNCNDPYALAIGPFGSNLKVSDYRDEGVPLIFVRNIRSGIFKDENTKYVSETKASELRPHWVSGGDILITKMGDPPGDATLYPIGSPTGIITADCIKLNLFDEIQDASFFVYAFNSESVKKQIFSITMGVAQKKVSLKRFKTIALPLPPLPEQHEIVRRVDALFALADQVETGVAAARERTGAMRQSVLAQAFSGRLVPTEAELARREGREYEPAAVLLERVRAGGKKGTQSRLV